MHLEKIEAILQAECHLNREKPILVGVSGGPDSLSLLDVLNRLGYPLVVAHLNHNLRPEAEQEAQQVAELARQRDLPFVTDSQDVRALARIEMLSLEEAARNVRYRFLFGEARRVGAQAVAVGHNADDQVETLLMHLLRGAGLSGLKGMRSCSQQPEWDAHIPLIRPLLGIWREEILAYCTQRQLDPVHDLSNLDTTYFRNRLRHELVPFLEKFNPRIRPVLWRTSRALAGDYEVLEGVRQAAWEKCLIEQGAGYVLLDRGCLTAQERGMQRSLVRQAFSLLRPSLRDIDFESVERTLAFINNPPDTNQADLVAGIRLLLEADRLFIALWQADLPGLEWPQIQGEQPLWLDVPGQLDLGQGWRITSELLPQESLGLSQYEQVSDPFQAWLDAGTLELPLEVRGRKPGDRFQPLGMETHSVKMSDFFVNVKLPRRGRDRWPLICSKGGIVWVPGYRPGHPFRLTEHTLQAVHLWIKREPAVDQPTA